MQASRRAKRHENNLTTRLGVTCGTYALPLGLTHKPPHGSLPLVSVQGWLEFDENDRKARGAFFTPEELAGFLAEWAVRTPSDRVLDPSCGEAALLLAAGRRMQALGGRTALHGFDLHLPSIDAAQQLLAQHGLKSNLQVADFFEVPPLRRFDAIIGNPPYIRYQSFTGADRLKAQQAALAQGVRLSGLANAWAAFVIHATAFLKPTGRLAIVLPAVLLSVNYAAPIRRFLLSRFGSIKLVMFEERVFPEVQEEVVLLLAEGKGPTPQFDVFQVRDVRGLEAISGMPDTVARAWKPTEATDKWTEALLSVPAGALYTRTIGGPNFTPLLEWGETDLGMVTGNNNFFTLTANEVDQLGLTESEVRKISPPGSRHLRGLTFTKRAFRDMAQAGHRVFLFYPADKPSPAAARYIRSGEESGVHEAFKCSVRSPWWRVPGIRVPDLFFTYMNQDAPRLVSNEARAAHLNSIHGVALKPQFRELGIDLLPLAMLNSVTLLGAELVGRSYGGGILKVEPKEADQLPMPAPALIESTAERLRALRPQLATHLRNNALDKIVEAVDDVLAPHLGLKASDVTTLAEARAMMAARRSSRAGKTK